MYLRRFQSIKIILILTLFILCYQNCGSGEFPLTAHFNQITWASLSSRGDPFSGPEPLIGELVEPGVFLAGTLINRTPDCFTNPNYNACLFWKNPVATNGAPLSRPITANSDLSGLQIHAVNINATDYGDSNFLQNSSFTVAAVEGVITRDGGIIIPQVLARVTTTGSNFKFNYGNDPDHRFSQVAAFYWINLQIKFMTAWVGNFFAKDKNIQVWSWFPNVANAFWKPYDNLVVIGSDDSMGGEWSLAAEMYLHEMGHANFGYATNFNIYARSNSDRTQNCHALLSDTCCRDSRGCIGAIDEGQADYHAALLFPTNTAIGESLVNNVDGIDECGVTRNINSNRNLTAASAYNACDRLFRGEVHLMGRVYASIWWQIRKMVGAVEGLSGLRAIDKLFNEHLAVLSVSDSFVDALKKIKALDQVLFNGKYSFLFENEFARRGIY